MVVLAGLEPTSFPNLGIMVYKTTALPLSYRTMVPPVGLEPTLKGF